MQENCGGPIPPARSRLAHFFRSRLASASAKESSCGAVAAVMDLAQEEKVLPQPLAAGAETEAFALRRAGVLGGVGGC